MSHLLSFFLHVITDQVVLLHAKTLRVSFMTRPFHLFSSLPSTHRSSSDDLAPWLLGCCSAASASLASIATQPMDVIKTRLQVMSASPNASQPTVMSVARQALQQEGMKVQ